MHSESLKYGFQTEIRVRDDLFVIRYLWTDVQEQSCKMSLEPIADLETAVELRAASFFIFTLHAGHLIA